MLYTTVNKMIDLLCSHIGIVVNYLLFYRNIQSFTMPMPFKMIFVCDTM